MPGGGLADLNTWNTTQQSEQTNAVGQNAQATCPLLGLHDDPATRALYPRSDHRCGTPGVDPPALDWQTRYCLNAQHTQCPHFAGRQLEPASPGGTGRRKSGRPRWLIVTTILAGLAALLGTGIVLAVVVGMATPGFSTSTVTSTPDQSGGTPSTQPQLAQAPAVLTPEPTLVPSTNSPSPPAAADPPARHTVAPGETLGEIAERYDTTVAELVRINQINDPRTIPVGMVLQLHAPEPEPGSGAP
jgi:LysM repeat protein